MLKQILFSIFLLFYQFTHLQTNNIHPNFVLILADDQGWNGTSVKMIDNKDFSKSDFYETPNIERIAEKGVIFSNAYASAPVCAPSRYSIQFGQTPARLKMIRVGMNTDHTLEEVGLQFSVTRERIRQIEAKALRKLRHPSRSDVLKSFLHE